MMKIKNGMMNVVDQEIVNKIQKMKYMDIGIMVGIL